MIYGISEDGDRSVIKIGYTSSPNNGVSYKAVRARLSGLQVSTWRELVCVAAMPGSHQCEQRLHQEFIAHHVRGEWFRNEGAVADWARRWLILPLRAGRFSPYQARPIASDEIPPLRRQLEVVERTATQPAANANDLRPLAEQAGTFIWRGKVRPL